MASDELCIVLTLPERGSYHPASIVRNLRSQWVRATAIEDEPDHIRTAFRIRTGTEERARGIELDFSDSEPAPVLKASARTLPRKRIPGADRVTGTASWSESELPDSEIMDDRRRS